MSKSNKSKSRKSESIKSKILKWTISIIVLVGTILITYSYTNSKNLELDAGIDQLENHAKTNDLIIEQRLFHTADINQEFSRALMAIRENNDIDNKREILEEIITKSMVEQTDLIGYNIIMEPNAFDNRDSYYIDNDKYAKNGQYVSYITIKSGEANIVTIDDAYDLPFYIKTKETKDVIISEPYYFDIQGTDVLIITIAKPLYDEDKNFIGVVGIDITMEYFEKVVSEFVSATESIILFDENGKIIFNNFDGSINNENISKAGLDNSIIISELESNSIISRENQNRYEVITKIEVPHISNNWYICFYTDMKVLTDKTIESTLITAAIGIATLIFAFLLLWIIINKIVSPLIIFVENMKLFDIENLDGELTVLDDSASEILDLSKEYTSLIDKLKENLTERNYKDWLQKGQVSINDISQTTNELNKLLSQIISFVTKKVEGQIGAIYLLNEQLEENQYELSSSYAYQRRKGIAVPFKLGEGLVGQAALDNEIIIISDIPEDYLAINSGLGNKVPKNIIIVPCSYQGKVVAILEIASISEFSDNIIKFLDLIKTNVAISISNILNFESVERLLKDANEFASKLQIQQEELRVTNEELEIQSVTLTESQAELESQQEELRVINEELEENTKMLEIQKTELERKNDELNISQVEVEAKARDLVASNKYKSEFLANMSHELRTPLNSILILSELLGEQNSNLTEKQLEFAKTINTSGNDLLKLINDILDLSKVEAGKVEIDIKELNIYDFKADILGMFEQMAIKKNLLFSINIEDGLMKTIMTDELKVKQIVKNLISNAFKFTENGSIELNIRKENSIIKFEVKDTGVGIATDKIKTIFEAFQQEDGTISREFGGTGLGLSISTEYAKLLNAELTVISEKNKGSIFSLNLPIDNNMILPDKNPVKKIKESKKTVEEKKPLEDSIEIIEKPLELPYVLDDRNNIDDTDKVLLIIDDDPNFAKIIMDISRAKKFKVIVAETGEVGLYLADYYRPTGIVLDLGLPKIDGLEVLERLKKNNRTKNIPVSIISGRELENENFGKNVEYLKKPVSKVAIENILDNAELAGYKINKILLIEDNEIHKNALVELIKRDYKDIEIHASESGELALEILRNNNIDLIVLDLGLIDYDEFEFIEKLKMNDSFSKIPVIVYTGKEISKQEEKDLRDKVESIIIKGDKSSQRLLDEIKLFVHNVANTRKEITAELEQEIFNGKTILVVDDDMRNVFALSSILESININIEIANNGIEAIEKITELNNIDLVLMDIMMPIMDGYEAMKEIRKMKKGKDIAIIALTAKAMKGDRQICLDAGANEYLSKPIDRSKLLSLLRVWL